VAVSGRHTAGRSHVCLALFRLPRHTIYTSSAPACCDKESVVPPISPLAHNYNARPQVFDDKSMFHDWFGEALGASDNAKAASGGEVGTLFLLDMHRCLLPAPTQSCMFLSLT